MEEAEFVTFESCHKELEAFLFVGEDDSDPFVQRSRSALAGIDLHGMKTSFESLKMSMVSFGQFCKICEDASNSECSKSMKNFSIAQMAMKTSVPALLTAIESVMDRFPSNPTPENVPNTLSLAPLDTETAKATFLKHHPDVYAALKPRVNFSDCRSAS